MLLCCLCGGVLTYTVKKVRRDKKKKKEREDRKMKYEESPHFASGI